MSNNAIEFMNAMKLMNNGLHRESTLKNTYPILLRLGASINPNSLEGITDWALKEECLAKSHPGWDETIIACNSVVETFISQKQQSKTM